MFFMRATDTNSTRAWWIAAFALLLLATALQLFNASQTVINGGIRGDARDYVVYAINLDLHGVYGRQLVDGGNTPPPPDGLRAPGYPLFLSLFIDPRAKDLGLPAVVTAQALLGVATVLLCLLLFRRVLPPWWALGAAALVATSPHLINVSVYYLTESLFTFLLVLHLFALERGYAQESRRWLLFAGVALAASILVRPTTQYLVVFYAIALLLMRGISPRARIVALACLLVPVLVSSGAWAVRNIQTSGYAAHPVMQSNFLHHGMYINMMYKDDPKTYGYPYQFDPDSAALSGNTPAVVAAIIESASADPVRYAQWVLVGKPTQFLAWNLTESIGGPFIYAPVTSPWKDSTPFRLLSALTAGLHGMVMLLAVAGAALALWRWISLSAAPPGFVILAVVFLYFILLHMVGSPFPRYSIPLRPVCYGLAVYALHEVWQALQAQRSGANS
jgi:4-amino-4-deoxy-L-arabinose transferase-like glycosyltransferase